MDQGFNESRFNAGLAKLERIHKLKMRVHEARIANDYETMAECLIGWSCEMHERMAKEGPAIVAESARLQREMETQLNQIGQRKDFVSSFNFRKKAQSFDNFLSEKEYKYKMSLPDAEDWHFAAGGR